MLFFHLSTTKQILPVKKKMTKFKRISLKKLAISEILTHRPVNHRTLKARILMMIFQERQGKVIYVS